MRNLKDLVRPNVWALKPYSSARDEYKGTEASVFLDANESPYNCGLNRYPDPLQEELKARLAPLKGVRPEQMFLGNGSDEAIDLVYRVFCRPQLDNVVAIDPTYGMYEVCADINDVEYRKVPLNERFQFSAEILLDHTSRNTKAIFLCSPNNPSGNNLDVNEVVEVLRTFEGIVVVDEAYSDFSSQPTFRSQLDRFPNLIVLNTFSKAWACASIRLGIALAQPEIIKLFNKVKYPYNVNNLTQQEALKMIDRKDDVFKWTKLVLEERERMLPAFNELPICQTIYPTDANFFLARMTDAPAIYSYLLRRGIIVRNRSHIALCGNCLRITIGNAKENSALLGALRQYGG
jgi:histidinol-phosphate aminotransferase